MQFQDIYFLDRRLLVYSFRKLAWFMQQIFLTWIIYLSFMSACQCLEQSSSIPSDERSDDPNVKVAMMMMRGVTAKDVDPVRYSGRWSEVACLKCGFAGQGQEDRHAHRYTQEPNPGDEFIAMYKA